MAVAETQSSPASALAVEQNGINVIAESERRGQPRDLFWPWCAANISVLAISYGSFLLAFGIGFWQGVFAGVVGTVFSFLLVGLVSLAGKRGSAPTMVLSRAPFGVRGNNLPTASPTCCLSAGRPSLSRWRRSRRRRSSAGSGGPTATSPRSSRSSSSRDHHRGRLPRLHRNHAAADAVDRRARRADCRLHRTHRRRDRLGRRQRAAVRLGARRARGPHLRRHCTRSRWVNAGADYSRYQRRTSSSGGVVWWTTFGGSIAPIVLIVYGLLLAGVTLS